MLTNGGHGEEVQASDKTEKSRKREGVSRAAQKTSSRIEAGNEVHDD